MEKLLVQVSKIVDTDRKIQEERRLRGEQFNVFSVLGLYQHEVELHSKLIGELLNVKGSHGLRDVEDRPINMGRASLLEKLHKDSLFCNKFVEHVCSIIVAYVNQKAPQLIAYFNR